MVLHLKKLELGSHFYPETTFSARKVYSHDTKVNPRSLLSKPYCISANCFTNIGKNIFTRIIHMRAKVAIPSDVVIPYLGVYGSYLLDFGNGKIPEI